METLALTRLVRRDFLLLGGALALPSATLADDPWTTSPKMPGVRPRGVIKTPALNTQVEQVFSVAGTIAGNYRDLWLAVKVHDRFWPKEPQLVPVKGAWQGEVHEEGRPPGGRFELLLLDVPPSSTAYFKQWLMRGHNTGRYPGIPSATLRDVHALHRITLRL